MKYENGKIIKGCVTGIESYGIFMSFDEYYSGLIHISEISNNFVRNVNDYVNIGETIRVKIRRKLDETVFNCYCDSVRVNMQRWFCGRSSYSNR